MLYRSNLNGIMDWDGWYTQAFYHSGGTDIDGGHRDTKNVSKLGAYHLHHTLSPHLHVAGICIWSPVQFPIELFKPLFQWIEEQVEYVSTYTDNPRKIADMIIGILSGMLQDCIKSAMFSSAILTVAIQCLANMLAMQPADTYLNFTWELFNDASKTIVEKIDLAPFTIYQDAFYLGKLIGQAISISFGLIGTVAGVLKILGAVGLGGSGLLAAPGTGGISVAALVPAIAIAIEGVAEAVISISIVAAAVGNVGDDIKTFKEETERIGKKYSEDEINEILNDLRGNGFKNNPLRQAYENEVRNLSEMKNTLLNQEKSEEEIARTLHQARRDLGVKYKNATPQPLRDYIYEISVQRYGDPLGPSFE